MHVLNPRHLIPLNKEQNPEDYGFHYSRQHVEFQEVTRRVELNESHASSYLDTLCWLL